MSKIAEFKKELRELMSKYGASICVEYAPSPDMHGVIDGHIIVELDGRSHHLCDHWGVGASDLT